MILFDNKRLFAQKFMALSAAKGRILVTYSPEIYSGVRVILGSTGVNNRATRDRGGGREFSLLGWLPLGGGFSPKIETTTSLERPVRGRYRNGNANWNSKNSLTGEKELRVWSSCWKMTLVFSDIIIVFCNITYDDLKPKIQKRNEIIEETCRPYGLPLVFSSNRERTPTILP